MNLVYTTLTEVFYCKELLFKDYKAFLKSFYGDDVDKNQVIKSFFDTLCSISNKPIEFFSNLSMVELFLLLIQLRIYTLGDICQITIKNEEESNKTIHLNLESMKQMIIEYVDFNFPCIVEDEHIKIALNFPSINKITLNDEVENYIHSCAIKDKILNNMTREQSIEVFQKLPARIASELVNKQQKLLSEFKLINFLAPYEGCSKYHLNFDLTLNNFFWYCRLFFNESLEALFDNLFYLSYVGKFDLSYIENFCTPGEYIYFIKKLNATLSENKKASEPESVQPTSSESLNGM